MQIHKQRFFYGWVIVAAAVVVTIVAGGTYYTFGVFFQPLCNDFGWTRATTAGAFSLYLVVHGLVGIVAGRFTDKRGPRLVVGSCALFLAIGYLLLSHISTVWQLYLSYGIFIGVGMCGVWIPQAVTITKWFVAKRGMVLGIVAAGSGIGQLIFPLLARYIISTDGWRMGYFIMGIAALIFIGVASLFLKNDPEQAGLSPYGAEQVEHTAVSEGNIAGEIEWTLPQAVRTRSFWIFGAMYILFGFGYVIPFVHVVAHATDIGIPSMSAAGILSLIGIGGIAGRFTGGVVSDKIGRKMAISICLAMVGISILWLLIADEVWMFYLFGAVFGFCFGGTVPILPALCGEFFGLRSMGIIYGTLILFFTVGAAISGPLAGYMFDVTYSYRLAFIVGGLTSLLAAAITFFHLKPPRPVL